MNKVIKNLKSMIRRYGTCLQSGKEFILFDDELESIRKAIRYLELIDSLAKSYNGKSSNDKPVQ